MRAPGCAPPLRRQLREAQGAAAALRAVAKLGHAVEAVDGALAARDFAAAAAQLAALDARLAALRAASAGAAAAGAASGAAAAGAAAACAFDGLVALVAAQAAVRRAEAKAALDALWRFAVAAEPLAPAPSVGGAGEFAGGAALRLHVRLEGLCAGVSLDAPLPLDQVLSRRRRHRPSLGALHHR